MRKIFDVLDELQWLQRQEYDGCPVDTEWMQEIQAEFDDVIASLVAILKEANSDLETLRACRRDISEKEKRVQQRVTDLKAMILHSLQSADRKRGGSLLHAASVSDSTPRVVVIDEDKIPDRFWETQRTLRKSDIADYINKGYQVPGADMVRGQHVRVK